MIIGPLQDLGCVTSITLLLLLLLLFWFGLEPPTRRSRSKSAHRCIPYNNYIGVCKILYRSVEIWQYERQKPILSKSRARPSLCLGLAVHQNEYVFVILVTKSYIKSRRRIAAISAANRQSGGEDGCYRKKKFRNFVARAEPDAC